MYALSTDVPHQPDSAAGCLRCLRLAPGGGKLISRHTGPRKAAIIEKIGDADGYDCGKIYPEDELPALRVCEHIKQEQWRRDGERAY